MLFCQNGHKNRFKMCFYSYVKKCHLRFSHKYTFCHWLIIHDDKTVLSYFMHRHQTLKFSYNFKAKVKVPIWIWWTKIDGNLSILGRLSVIKWRNWTWWESYLNAGISDETQVAVVVWLQWSWGKLFVIHDVPLKFQPLLFKYIVIFCWKIVRIRKL